MTISDRHDAEDQGMPDFAREWLDEPEKLLQAAQNDAALVERKFRAIDSEEDFRPHSLINVGALTFAFADPASHTLSCMLGAERSSIEALVDWDVAASTLRTGTLAFAPAAGGKTSHPLLAYVPLTEAARWNLPEALHGALVEAPQSHILVVTTTAAEELPLRKACAAFGMTGLETRIIEATLRTGSIRAGALEAGVSYATAREAMSSALAKGGATRMPGLLHRLSLLALGVYPNSDDATGLLSARWGLSERQAAIAMLIAQGMTRKEAAQALKLSEATVKKQVDVVFEALGVAGAAEAARLMTAVTAIQALSDASPGRVSWFDSDHEPLRLVRRPDDSRIAVSDYGPAGAPPVVILHSSMTSRHPPRGLVAALQAEGRRVLAIDRPGFGLSDPVQAAPPSDPFGPAAHDMARVLDQLKLRRADIIARGGAQVAVAFAALYPARCGRVILVNPDPLSSRDSRRSGVLGAFKEAYLQRPTLILPAARLLARLMTRKYFAKVMSRSMRGSPPDEKLVADDRIVDDYYRAVRLFSSGRIEGYVREQAYFAAGTDLPYRVEGNGWKVLIGEHDTLSDPANSMAYWRALLPKACFEIAEGEGRLLAYGAPQLIIDRLLGPAQGSAAREAAAPAGKLAEAAGQCPGEHRDMIAADDNR